MHRKTLFPEAFLLLKSFCNTTFYRDLDTDDVYYYPYDINPTMISKAIKQISDDNDDIFKRLKIKAMVADFNDLQDFRPVYEYRPAPNIFTFLGNTLGNYQTETGLLKTIRNAMNTDDVLLLEVRLLAGIPSLQTPLKPDGDLEMTKKFNFEPLDSLGVKFQRDNLDYKIESGHSQVENTSTLFCLYNAEIPGITNPKNKGLRLSCVQYYDENKLSNHLRNTIEFRIEATIKNTSNTLALYVLRK